MHIEIDEEVFAALQRQAVPLVDSPNDVLRRLLALETTEQRAATEGEAGLQLPVPHRSAQRSAASNGTAGARSAKRRSKSRRAAGELLPLEDYCGPILRALVDSGGELRSRDVPEALASLLEPHLFATDRELDADGVPIWHRRVGWAGSLCRKAGHLDREAPRGIWRLTDEGRKAVGVGHE